MYLFHLSESLSTVIPPRLPLSVLRRSVTIIRLTSPTLVRPPLFLLTHPTSCLGTTSLATTHPLHTDPSLWATPSARCVRKTLSPTAQHLCPSSLNTLPLRASVVFTVSCTILYHHLLTCFHLSFLYVKYQPILRSSIPPHVGQPFEAGVLQSQETECCFSGPSTLQTRFLVRLTVSMPDIWHTAYYAVGLLYMDP